jgi:hypothetical protein
MVVLGRNTPRLLKRVAGKQHANENDHDETFGRRRGQDTSTLTDEDQLNREPVSSGDEARPPPMPSPARLPKATNSAQKGNTESDSPALRLPQPRSAKKTTVLHIPRTGSFQRGKEDKEKRGLEGGDKISALSAPSSSNGNNLDDAWGFGLSSQPSSQSQKKQFGAKKNGTSNIHAPSLNPKSGPKKPVKYGARSRPVYNSNAEATLDSDEEVDMLDNNELDTALGEDEDKSTSDTQLRRPMAKKKRANDSDASQSKLDDEELDALLGSPGLRRPPAKKKRTNADPDSDLQLPQLREPTKKKKRTDDDLVASEAALFDDEEELETILGPDKPALLHQLGEWFQDRTPDSSQPQSSAPQEDVDNLDNLEGYIHKLPEEAPEGTICTICHEPVASSDYWAFWTHKLKTVKNQTAFCTSHRRQTAQEEYTREGYPAIDWPALPDRIKQHRMALHKVLTNEQPSTYRDRYAPLALTGKAAAVPSRHTAAAAASSYTLDDHATYPGYYGARGRRAITEAVMALLRNEIKRSRDPVVQTSGPAAFVQAVLVPEVAVRFIMEDCAVDRDEADAIREGTYEMGLLLNEEIEDEIEVGEESAGEGGEIGVL